MLFITVYSDHIIIHVKIIELWIVTNFEVVGPHEHTKFVSALENYFSFHFSIRVSDWLVQRNTNPVSLFESGDFADIFYLTSLGADGLASISDLNLAGLVLLLIRAGLSKVAFKIWVVFQLLFIEVPKSIISLIIILVVHNKLLNFRQVFKF